MNTTLGAAAGGLTAYLFGVFVNRIESVIMLSNGLLAGLVGITAGCAYFEPWSSIVIGSVSGILFSCGSWLVAFSGDSCLACLGWELRRVATFVLHRLGVSCRT